MQTKASPQEAQQVRSHKKNAAKHINRAHAKDSDSDSERSEWGVGSGECAQLEDANPGNI